MGSVNLRVLRKEILAQARKPMETRARQILENKIKKEIEKTIEELDSNPVTQEIEGGPNAPGSLPNGGNLFSFIGFNQGSEPIGSLRGILRKEIKLLPEIKTKMDGSKIIVEQTVSMPSLSTIYNKTAGKYGVGEWTNKSWLQLLEDGIPWLTSYLFRASGFKNGSRSTTGLQAKNKEGEPIKVREGGFPPVQYISKIMANLRDRIRRTTK